MDIKLLPIDGGADFTFPALPEKIKGSYAANYQRFDIISRGAVKVPKGIGVTEFSWDGEFFGESKQNESVVQRGQWQDPRQCVKILTDYMENETALNLIVTKTWINVDVTVSSFQPVAYGAFGNIRYTIAFTVKRDLKIFTADELKIAAFVKKTKPRNEVPPAPANDRTYTVVKGDTLWGLAVRYYGDGRRWEDIWRVNKDICEEPYTSGGTTYVKLDVGDVLTIP